MLGLQLETDERWVRLVENNIEEILVDHAYCEQKAATNAIYIIVNYPQYPDLVKAMATLAQEELQHFEQVHDLICRKGFEMGQERKDDYVNQLAKFMIKGRGEEQKMIDRLLFSAMIEARSCERFKMLSEKLEDEELKKFYHELMVSEATHYTLFIGFARKYATTMDVDKRWQEFLTFEADLMKNYSKKETIHG
jgi:tRNA-(ms[2]io[6]A)-hydroxylase